MAGDPEQGEQGRGAKAVGLLHFQRFAALVKGLSASELWSFTRVTEGIPLNPCAGFTNISTSWKPAMLLSFSFLVARMALNLYSSVMLATTAWSYQPDSSPDGKVLMCMTELEHECVRTTWHRLLALKAVASIEVVVVACGCCFTWGYFFAFLACKVTSLPGRCPWVFFFLPDEVSKYSLLSSLRYINTASLSAYLVRKEGMLFAMFWWELLAPASYRRHRVVSEAAIARGTPRHKEWTVEGRWIDTSFRLYGGCPISTLAGKWLPEDPLDENHCTAEFMMKETSPNRAWDITERQANGEVRTFKLEREMGPEDVLVLSHEPSNTLWRLRRMQAEARCAWDFSEASVESDEPLLPCLGGQFASLLALAYTALMFLVAFVALVVKVSLVHFIVARVDFNISLSEFLVLIGFLGQVAGISNVKRVELVRILCFKFGGQDSVWQRPDCEACIEYMHQFGRAIVEDKVGNAGSQLLPRLRALAMMSTLDSDLLQKLLLSRQQEKQQQKSRIRRFQLFKELFHDRDLDFGDLGGDEGCLPASAVEKTEEFLAFMKSSRNLLVGARLQPHVSSGSLGLATELEQLTEYLASWHKRAELSSTSVAEWVSEAMGRRHHQACWSSTPAPAAKCDLACEEGDSQGTLPADVKSLLFEGYDSVCSDEQRVWVSVGPVGSFASHVAASISHAVDGGRSAGGGSSPAASAPALAAPSEDGEPEPAPDVEGGQGPEATEHSYPLSVSSGSERRSPSKDSAVLLECGSPLPAAATRRFAAQDSSALPESRSPLVAAAPQSLPTQVRPAPVTAAAPAAAGMQEPPLAAAPRRRSQRWSLASAGNRQRAAGSAWRRRGSERPDSWAAGGGGGRLPAPPLPPPAPPEPPPAPPEPPPPGPRRPGPLPPPVPPGQHRPRPPAISCF